MIQVIQVFILSPIFIFQVLLQMFIQPRYFNEKILLILISFFPDKAKVHFCNLFSYAFFPGLIHFIPTFSAVMIPDFIFYIPTVARMKIVVSISSYLILVRQVYMPAY